eukprot:TRINITY_DN26572_c0_g1_i1.p1 TRINITY_DN26572_c0_g1~~TRINITY_DN26572_c0_g1_i1.p1  ORF type:complete len:218 (-),score=24.54 TRINITY_DN26572_c0_g1_i1:36-689(-)
MITDSFLGALGFVHDRRTVCTQFVEALLLASSLSTDNFVVGVVAGLSGRHFKARDNFIIASANALGQVAATTVGIGLAKLCPHLGNLSPIVFGCLGIKELYQAFTTETSKKLACGVSESQPLLRDELPGRDLMEVLSVAFALSVSNLVGGVAGGLAGLPIFVCGVTGLQISYAFLAVGQYLGRKMGDKLQVKLQMRTVTFISAGLFFAIALVQIFLG